MFSPDRIALFFVAGSLMACGGGGGSGSSGDDDEVMTPTVQFAEAASAFSETSGTVEFLLNLSEATTQEVQVPFTLSGSAVQDQDFMLVSVSPVVLAVGATEASIQVDLVDDHVAFGVVEFELQLGAPTGATLGTIVAHTVTLIDDEVPIQEIEGNDTLVAASKNGSLATLPEGGILSIAGSVAESGDLFDVHRLTVPLGAALRVTATFAGPHPDLLVTLTNAQGVPYADELDADSVTFDVDAGRLYCVVQSTGSQTDYQVRLEAVATP